MHNLYIAKTHSTPAIHADGMRGVLSLSGDSYPENPLAFFQPVHDWLGCFLSESAAPLTVELELLYLNTSSIRAMIELFDRIEMAHRAGRGVSVIWRYEAQNEQVARLAQEFREDFNFWFNIVAKA